MVLLKYNKSKCAVNLQDDMVVVTTGSHKSWQVSVHIRPPTVLRMLLPGHNHFARLQIPEMNHAILGARRKNLVMGTTERGADHEFGIEVCICLQCS